MFTFLLSLGAELPHLGVPLWNLIGCRGHTVFTLGSQRGLNCPGLLLRY